MLTMLSGPDASRQVLCVLLSIVMFRRAQAKYDVAGCLQVPSTFTSAYAMQ